MMPLFFGFAALLVVTSLMVVLHKNPVTSALFLVLAFSSLAGIYLLLHAEFLGMVQIVVYAGAIMVLFLFVIMYLNLQHDVETGLQTAVRRGIGWFTGAALVLTGATLLRRGWSLGPAYENLADAEHGNVVAIGKQLYSRYLFPFEITSILLLVAMVGVIIIARGRAKTA
ncbi:MAG: NADH-quinone oxidoreductase subunit J, partial [Candidatus Eisenbacteria bacterium]|nr:NADH-quinone oxidoreductase subunit J [Candidatus Eisenbacteria bacterium]